MSVETGVSAAHPLKIQNAYHLVVDSIAKRCPKAHYFEQLASDVACTFVNVLPDQVAVQKQASNLKYGATGNMIHLTETWTKLVGDTYPLASAVKQNKKRIFLAGDIVDESAAAHELLHWLSHPYWGLVFEPNSQINEGMTEGIMRELLGEKFNNKVYNDDVKVAMKDCGKDFKIEELLAAYLIGDIGALKIIVCSFTDMNVMMRFKQLNKQLQ
jgi:hypothetical protein